jgi:uncharacterized protein YndB with AHSA1/START domain
MKTIHHVFDIAAAPGKVWAALTEPQQADRWWSTRVTASAPAVGARTDWTFAGDFNPVMQTTALIPERELTWRCVAGHDPWTDNTFRFVLVPIHDHRCKVRFWQQYATELDDDAYGTYNYNWGYYLESLRLYCATGTGKPFNPPAPP